MKKNICLFFVFLSSSVVLAAPAPDQPDQEIRTEQKDQTPKPAKAGRVSSAENRKSKRFSVVSGIGLGYFPVPSPMLTMTGSMSLSPRQWLELNTTRIAGVEFYGLEQLETYANTLGLLYKSYLGNSFYADVGLGVKKIFAKHEGIFRFGKGKFEQDLFSSGALIGIGNRWQWSYFTLGVSWAEAYLPFSVSSKSKNIDSRVEADELSVREKRAKSRAGDLDLSIKFSLGASF